MHNDRNALYVFKLRYDGYPNTLPDMLYNGEVSLCRVPCLVRVACGSAGWHSVPALLYNSNVSQR